MLNLIGIGQEFYETRMKNKPLPSGFEVDR
jgi:hypothetical protein